MSTVHVVSERDRIAHRRDGSDCPCRPVTEPVRRHDGGYGWLVVHNAIDGRRERKPSRLRSMWLAAVVATAWRLGIPTPRHWACYREESA